MERLSSLGLVFVGLFLGAGFSTLADTGKPPEGSPQETHGSSALPIAQVVSEADAKALYESTKKFFEKESHSSMKGLVIGHPDFLPLGQGVYGGMACTNGSEGFAVIVFQTVGKGIVVKAYHDKPLKHFAERDEQAQKAKLEVWNNGFDNIPYLEKIDVPQVELHLQFGKELEKRGLLEKDGLQIRQKYMDGEGKELVAKIIQVSRLGRTWAEVQVENELLRMDRATLQIWEKKKTSLDKELAELRKKREQTKDKKLENRITLLTEFEKHEYDRLFGNPPDATKLPPEVKFLKFVEHADKSTLYQAKDADNHILESAEVFRTPDGSWGFDYSIPKKKADGKTEMAHFRCW
jgi:hypothetical protein